jgi:hypothetical protein
MSDQYCGIRHRGLFLMDTNGGTPEFPIHYL